MYVSKISWLNYEIGKNPSLRGYLFWSTYYGFVKGSKFEWIKSRVIKICAMSGALNELIEINLDFKD